jgi:hypothetical protein
VNQIVTQYLPLSLNGSPTGKKVLTPDEIYSTLMWLSPCDISFASDNRLPVILLQKTERTDIPPSPEDEK